MKTAKPHEFFAYQVAEAYVLYLMATNKRPVYRYSSGDIEVDRHFLSPLLDGYLAERKSEGWRCRFYESMLQKYHTPDPRSVFTGGTPPKLNRRGVRYMNALVHKFADMLEDIGGRDSKGMPTMPTDDTQPSNLF